MDERQKWKEFHYPKPKKIKPASYKLVGVSGQVFARGNYALCVHNKKKYPSAQIIPVYE